ncbi:MAG: M13 family metallopeptidase [Neisseriaceae bacterium]|nr:M13 family metallopeptidase [Neisseriaceae bacterium]
MLRILYLCCLFCCLAACNALEHPQDKKKSEDVLLSYQFDYSVRIQDDIYQFVNGRWLEFNPLPAGRLSSSPVADLIQTTQTQLLEILTSLGRNQYKENSNEFKLNLLYQNYIDENQREKIKLNSLNHIFNQIDAINNDDELSYFLSSMIKKGKQIPFIKWNVDPSYEDSSTYKLYLLGPNLILNANYFNEQVIRNRQVLKGYENFIALILRHLSIDNSNDLSKKVFLLEKELASYTSYAQEALDFRHQYVEMDFQSQRNSLQNLIVSIDPHQDTFFIQNIDYFSELDSILKHNDLETIKAYLKYFYFIYYSDYLDRVSYRLVFNFMQYKLLGRKTPFSLQDRAVDFVNYYMGDALGQLYVKKYFSKTSKKEILDLTEHIKKSFKNKLQDNTWMSQNTKETAIKKLEALRVKIAYPDKWKSYHDLSLQANELGLVGLVEQLDYWNFQNNQAKIGKKVDLNDWTIFPQTINAYYDILKNEVIYPAAILQPPFYYPSSDPAVLYGGLGSLIAHEMTHGFDLKGSHYDEMGNYRSWWNKKDREEFNIRAKALVNQYEQYSVIDDVTVNGLKTLNENIADLGGVSIAYDALLESISDKNIPEILGFSQQQRFFLAWASLFKGLDSKKALKNSYHTYVHSPDNVRAFAPLLNMDAFYKVFDIKPQDQLYINPEKRVKIW